MDTPKTYNRFLGLVGPEGWEEIWGPHGPLAALSATQSEEPGPEPWRLAVSQLVEAAQANDIASRLPEGRLKTALAKSASTAIETILDDWCGTPPRKWPWPWPGPPPWTWLIVSDLSVVANSLEAGSLRDQVLDVAKQVMQKASLGM